MSIFFPAFFYTYSFLPHHHRHPSSSSSPSFFFFLFPKAFPSDDPLDNPDFDPVDYINSLFPNEQALVKLDDFALKLKKKIWRVDNDIQVSIRGQTNVGSEEQALEDAQEGMTELFTRIRDIKQKAELSEKMVQEITRDIKSLDYAKKHLTGSITTLNHLKMLVSGVDTLNTLVKQRLYRDVANMLGAVLNVMEHFDKYTEIERIKVRTALSHRHFGKPRTRWGGVAASAYSPVSIFLSGLVASAATTFMLTYAIQMTSYHI